MGNRDVRAKYEWGWFQRLLTPAVPKPQGQVPAVRDEYKLIGRLAAGLPSLRAHPTLRGRDQLDLYLVLVVVHMSFCALKRSSHSGCRHLG